MKEYKVITPKLGFSNRMLKLEELFNQYAREGWVVNHCCGCRPFHDPGDHARIEASSFSGISTICGL